jgi:hypothetical protein
MGGTPLLLSEERSGTYSSWYLNPVVPIVIIIKLYLLREINNITFLTTHKTVIFWEFPKVTSYQRVAVTLRMLAITF